MNHLIMSTTVQTILLLNKEQIKIYLIKNTVKTNKIVIYKLRIVIYKLRIVIYKLKVVLSEYKPRIARLKKMY